MKRLSPLHVKRWSPLHIKKQLPLHVKRQLPLLILGPDWWSMQRGSTVTMHEKAIAYVCEMVIASVHEKVTTSACEKVITSVSEKAITSAHVKGWSHLCGKGQLPQHMKRHSPLHMKRQSKSVNCLCWSLGDWQSMQRGSTVCMWKVIASACEKVTASVDPWGGINNWCRGSTTLCVWKGNHLCMWKGDCLCTWKSDHLCVWKGNCLCCSWVGADQQLMQRGSTVNFHMENSKYLPYFPCMLVLKLFILLFTIDRERINSLCTWKGYHLCMWKGDHLST